MSYYYILAFPESHRGLPQKEEIVQKESEAEARKYAYEKYDEHEEIYVELCSEALLKEARKEGLLK